MTRARILPLVSRSPHFLPLRSILSPLFLSLLSLTLLRPLFLPLLLLRRFIVLLVLRPIRARSLRESRHSQRCTERY